MSKQLVAILHICVALWFAGCSANDDSTVVNRVVYGLTQDVAGIDLHIHHSEPVGIIARQIYDTLVYRDPQTRGFVPGLAESWSISDDRLEYTFTLRQNIVFHDGTPFNAEAVAANLRRITNVQISSERVRQLLGPMRGFQVIDPYTIRVVLSQPFEPLLDAFSQPYLGIASPAALAEFADEPLRYQYHQVGTGPFQMIEYIPQDRVVLRRSDQYVWGPPFYAQPQSHAIQEVEFRFFGDASDRLAALENGRAHIMGDLPPADARNIANDATTILLPTAIPGQPLQFYFNTQQPPTDRLAIRQALLFGINRAAIVDAVYQGFAATAWGPLSRDTLYYNRGVENIYAYNLDQAQSLLAANDYADTDNDGFLDRDGEPLTITVVQPPSDRVPDVVQALQTQWALLGVRVLVEPVPGDTVLLDRILDEPYNLVAFSSSGLDPALLNRYYLSSGSFNFLHQYQDLELDSTLLEAAQSSDPEVRRTLYGQMQGLTLQEALILPIRDQLHLNAHLNVIEGLTYDAYGLYPLLYNVSRMPAAD